jgi:hypothetical protein
MMFLSLRALRLLIQPWQKRSRHPFRVKSADFDMSAVCPGYPASDRTADIPGGPARAINESRKNSTTSPACASTSNGGAVIDGEAVPGRPLNRHLSNRRPLQDRSSRRREVDARPCASIKHSPEIVEVNRRTNNEGLAARNPLDQNQITKGQRLKAIDVAFSCSYSKGRWLGTSRRKN